MQVKAELAGIIRLATGKDYLLQKLDPISQQIDSIHPGFDLLISHLNLVIVM